MTGRTDQVSGNYDVNGEESFGLSISADGRYVAFPTATPDGYSPDHVFVYDRVTATTEQVDVSSTGAQSDWSSGYPSISADGRYVAFESYASNLVPSDTNQTSDVFVHDRVTGRTERVSVSSTDAQPNSDSYAPSISADGRYVAFGSDASNLVPGDTNASADLFVHDRVTGWTERVSLSSAGAQVNDLTVDSWPYISGEGRYVAFASGASDLVPGDTNQIWDVFMHDRVTGQTERVSVSSTGVQGNKDSFEPSISADGRYVAFASSADNLVPSDTNYSDDVFVRDRGTQTGACSSAAIATLDWHNVHTGSTSGYGFAAVAAAGSEVCFGLTWSTNLPTPSGADLDLRTAPGTPVVPLFTGAPGPHTGGRTAWGCASATATVASGIARHPDRYLVTVRTAQYPGGAIAGLQP